VSFDLEVYAFMRSADSPLEVVDLAQDMIAWNRDYVRAGGSLDDELAATVIPDLTI
jgi:hypothetical protein